MVLLTGFLSVLKYLRFLRYGVSVVIGNVVVVGGVVGVVVVDGMSERIVQRKKTKKSMITTNKLDANERLVGNTFTGHSCKLSAL